MPAEMNDQAAQPSTGRPPAGNPSIACIPCVLGVWLAAQLAALALGAAGVALSARPPASPGALALHEMLAGQMLVASLIFPRLMREASAALLAIGSAWPMLILAAIVAERPAASLTAGGALVTIWLAGLAFASQLLRSHRLQLFGAALAILLCAGDAIVGYLSSEFAARPLWTGPLSGALRQVDDPWSCAPAWIVASLVLIAGALACLIRRARFVAS